MDELDPRHKPLRRLRDVVMRLARVDIQAAPGELPFAITKLRAEWGVETAAIHVLHEAECPHADTKSIAYECPCREVRLVVLPRVRQADA
jgi:hypothetical protein